MLRWHRTRSRNHAGVFGCDPERRARGRTAAALSTTRQSNGTLVNWLDTGLAAASLAGMAFGPDGKLYLVDMLGSRVLRVDPG